MDKFLDKQNKTLIELDLGKRNKAHACFGNSHLPLNFGSLHTSQQWLLLMNDINIIMLLVVINVRDLKLNLYQRTINFKELGGINVGKKRT